MKFEYKKQKFKTLVWIQNLGGGRVAVEMDHCIANIIINNCNFSYNYYIPTYMRCIGFFANDYYAYNIVVNKRKSLSSIKEITILIDLLINKT